jgi:hypothetical protein
MKTMKSVSPLFLVLLLAMVLAGPAYAQESNGLRLAADIGGQITVTRQDGSEQTIDYTGRLFAGLRGGNIVIDVIGAGVVQGTGEEVSIVMTNSGVAQRQGNQLLYQGSGVYRFERQDGSNIVIDVISAGVIRARGNSIIIDVIGAGVVRGSGEQIVIDVIGAGVIQGRG